MQGEANRYGAMKLPELHAELKQRGLSIKGQKPGLIQRLQEYDKKSNVGKSKQTTPTEKKEVAWADQVAVAETSAAERQEAFRKALLREETLAKEKTEIGASTKAQQLALQEERLAKETEMAAAAKKEAAEEEPSFRTKLLAAAAEKEAADQAETERLARLKVQKEKAELVARGPAPPSSPHTGNPRTRGSPKTSPSKRFHAEEEMRKKLQLNLAGLRACTPPLEAQQTIPAIQTDQVATDVPKDTPQSQPRRYSHKVVFSPRNTAELDLCVAAEPIAVALLLLFLSQPLYWVCGNLFDVCLEVSRGMTLGYITLTGYAAYQVRRRLVDHGSHISEVRAPVVLALCKEIFKRKWIKLKVGYEAFNHGVPTIAHACVAFVTWLKESLTHDDSYTDEDPYSGDTWESPREKWTPQVFEKQRQPPSDSMPRLTLSEVDAREGQRSMCMCCGPR